MRTRTLGDQVGEHGDRAQVPPLGQQREPERVQAVAREQRQVAVLGAQHAALAVVLLVALADRREHRRVRALAVGRRVRRDRGGEQAALGAQRLRERHGAISSNAAAAASSVRVRCSGVWASDGNQASNCDGGG